jgi:TolB-like protein
MIKFFRDLRRRKVFGVAAGYVVMGWLLVEVASLLFETFGAPGWVLKVFITCVFLGFPIAVVLAWAYELTPEGVLRTEDLDATEEGPSQSEFPAAEGIAVLPLVSLSQDVDDEYLANGIAEEIINALAQISGLKVAARTSAFSFKDKDVDLKEIGKALGVSRVLEGSLRRVGDQLRVTAQLINVADGYQLWSERYDRQMVDIFSIQDEIAQAIAARIAGKTSDDSLELDPRVFTDNLEAYELYLKGKHCWARAGEYFVKGIEYTDRARQLDPEFAQAHAWYAIMQVYLVFFGYAKGSDCASRAADAANMAMEIDENLPESHIAFGIVRQYFFFDWTATEKHYEKARELLPGDAITAAWTAVYLTRFPDRYEECLTYARQAVNIDPLSADHNAILAWILWNSGSYTESLAVLENIQEMHPLYPLGYAFAGAILATQGRAEAGVVMFEGAPELARNDPMYKSFFAFTLGKAGKTEQAQELIDEILLLRKENHFGTGYLCVAYLGLDDKKQALRCAETAVKEIDAFFTYAGTLPVFSDLKDEPRFQQALATMDLSPVSDR